MVPFSGVRGPTKSLMLFEIERLAQLSTLMVNELELKLQVLLSSLVLLRYAIPIGRRQPCRRLHRMAWYRILGNVEG